jgi:hypothetical protein
MCDLNGWDENSLYERTVKFLEVNREMSWNRGIFSGKSVEKDILDNKDKIRASLDYLADLDIKESNYNIEKNLKPIYDTHLIDDIMTYALNKMKDFPYDGEKCYSFLWTSYLDGIRHTNNEILELYDLSRTSAYRRRKDSVLLFGIIMWSFAIPYLREHIEDSISEFGTLLKSAGAKGL